MPTLKETLALSPPPLGEGRVGANPWPLRRERAAELATRYPYADQMLGLYQALIPVNEAAYLAFLPNTSRTLPPPCGEGRGGGTEIAEYAVNQVMPSVIDVTVASGPATLRDGVIKVFCTGNLSEVVRGWLAQKPLNPFETYLARASTSPLLEAMPHSSLPLVGTDTPSPLRGGSGRGSLCPNCGGLPQLSYFAVTGEALVTGPRYLVCSRCSNAWVFSRMTCANCGESDGGKLPIFQDSEQLTHVRIDGCRTCGKYLLTFDLRREPKAVPIVDELAALPLDLYARDQRLTKITPNLLGN